MIQGPRSRRRRHGPDVDIARRRPARVDVAAGGYGAGDATAAAQQEVRSYQVSGLRTPATTCRIASITSSG